MITRSPEVVVVHPASSGLGKPDDLMNQLRAAPDIVAIAPTDARGVTRALASGATALVTYEWRDSYLTPSLRWVQGQGVGTDQYPIETFRERGIVLTNAAGIQSAAMAEHAFGLLLAMTRGIVTSTRDGAQRRWASTEPSEIAGMTLGILGMGSVGEAIAQRAVGWGLTVLGTKRHPETYKGRDATVYAPDRLRDVCAAADLVICCLPGGETTRHAIGAAELEALSGGWLVNIGRGSVIDEAALIVALQEGTLRGAALDVFEAEPLPEESLLWKVENLVITPHRAGYTQHHQTRLAAVISQNLRALRGGGPWVNRVV